MNSNTKRTGYGHVTLTHFPVDGQIRVKEEHRADDGSTLFSIPTTSAGSTGIAVVVKGQHLATFHHVAVDSSNIAYAYAPELGNYRDVRLGPCSITMDGDRL